MTTLFGISDLSQAVQSEFVRPGTDRFYSIVETPAGPMRVTSDGDSLLSLELPGFAPLNKMHADYLHDDARLKPVAREIAAYFDGELTRFSIPLAPSGTPFQLSVWSALLDIEYGTTRSYGEIAGAIGRPKAFRAVGMANHVNPIALIIPCHRVIGANGSLTGYGGGLALKEYLLAHESRIRSQAAMVPFGS